MKTAGMPPFMVVNSHASKLRDRSHFDRITCSFNHGQY